jgi:hypothetical protein
MGDRFLKISMFVIEKTLFNSEIMHYSMKVVKLAWIVVILIIFLMTSSTVQAQDDEEDTSADACIFSTFCVTALFFFGILYLISRRKTRDNQQYQRTSPPGYPPRQPEYRFPPPPTYQTTGSVRGQRTPPPQKTEIKCDLCNSKNLRVFEGGYYKCNDCRHVFYHTETTRRRR